MLSSWKSALKLLRLPKLQPQYLIICYTFNRNHKDLENPQLFQVNNVLFQYLLLIVLMRSIKLQNNKKKLNKVMWLILCGRSHIICCSRAMDCFSLTTDCVSVLRSNRFAIRKFNYDFHPIIRRMRRYIFGWLAIVLYCQQHGAEHFHLLTVEPYQTAYQFDFYFSFVIFNKINYICFIRCFYHFNLILLLVICSIQSARSFKLSFLK